MEALDGKTAWKQKKKVLGPVTDYRRSGKA